MKKIVILHTDVSQDASEDELDCLRQAEAVFEALTLSGHDPVLMPFVPDLAANIDRLHQISPRAVFNLVETFAEGKPRLSGSCITRYTESSLYRMPHGRNVSYLQQTAGQKDDASVGCRHTFVDL